MSFCRYIELFTRYKSNDIFKRITGYRLLKAKSIVSFHKTSFDLVKWNHDLEQTLVSTFIINSKHNLYLSTLTVLETRNRTVYEICNIYLSFYNTLQNLNNIISIQHVYFISWTLVLDVLLPHVLSDMF